MPEDGVGLPITEPINTLFCFSYSELGSVTQRKESWLTQSPPQCPFLHRSSAYHLLGISHLPSSSLSPGPSQWFKLFVFFFPVVTKSRGGDEGNEDTVEGGNGMGKQRCTI